ncbi:hypothetical protein ONZ45_g15393 [Pleurotus djamor]|nr:hypothetical protein ONZ45_g15393 [Pleurotus djamor]
MQDLPHEIWLHIVHYIPDDELKKLYSVNSLFLDLALNTKYKELTFQWLNLSEIRLLNRIQDPYIAHRVEKFGVAPLFAEYLVRLEMKQKSLLNRTLTRLGVGKHFTKQVKRELTTTLPHLHNIREYTLFWDPKSNNAKSKNSKSEDKLISHDVAISDELRLRYLCDLFALSSSEQIPTSYHYYFLQVGFDSALGQADWQRCSIGRFFNGLPAQLIPKLSHLTTLNIYLTSHSIWSEGPLFRGWNATSLSQLLSLINEHFSTLENISFRPPLYYDLTPLIAGLNHFPRLRRLCVDEPIDRAHMSDVSILQTFIETHRESLKELVLGPRLTCAFMEHDADIAWVPRVLADIHPFDLTSLHLGLLHHADLLSPVFEEVQRFSTGIQSLRILGKALQFDDICDLAQALSTANHGKPIPLRDLAISVDDLDPRTVDLLAEKFTFLTSLHICIDSNCTAIRRGMFARRMRDVRYPAWKLTNISVEIEKGSQLAHSIMEIFAISVPSIRYFKNREIKAHTSVDSEFTTFEMVKPCPSKTGYFPIV